MALLASSSKSGELRVVGGQVEGRLWLKDGCLVASSVGKAHGFVDAMFELLCLTEGNFVFKDGVDASAPEEAVPVEPIVHQAQERLREWRDIESVVPSLDHRVRLVPELPGPEVTVSADDWRLVMAIALAGTVRGVCDELALGHFEGCRGIRHLVDGGLVLVESPRVRPATSDPARHPRRAGTNGTEVSVAPAQVTLRTTPRSSDAPGVTVDVTPVVELRPLVSSMGLSSTLPEPVEAAQSVEFAQSVDEPPRPAVATRPMSLRLPPDVQRALNLPPSPDEAQPSPRLRPIEPQHAAQVVRDIMDERPPVFDSVALQQEPTLAVVRHLFAPKAEDSTARPASTPTVQPVSQPVAQAPAPQAVVAPAAPDGQAADYHLEAWKQATGVSLDQAGPVPPAPSGPAPAHEPEGDAINRGLLLKFLSSVRS